MTTSAFWTDTFGVFQALEKVLIVVGVPIAAYWTYYTFTQTDTEKARIAYEVNLARAKNFGLQIQINCSTATIGKRHYVRGGIDVQNMGAGLVRMDVSGPDVVVAYRLRYGPDGTPVLVDRHTLPFLTDRPSRHKGQAFVAQRRRYLPFSFAPKEDGIYFLRFTAAVQFSKDDDGLTDPVPWGASTTVVVDGNPNTCGAASST